MLWKCRKCKLTSEDPSHDDKLTKTEDSGGVRRYEHCGERVLEPLFNGMWCRYHGVPISYCEGLHKDEGRVHQGLPTIKLGDQISLKGTGELFEYAGCGRWVKISGEMDRGNNA